MKILCTCAGAGDVDTPHAPECAVAVAAREGPDRLATRKALSAVARARAKLGQAEFELRAIRARRTIWCACGGLHAIGELVLRVTHWYEEPHGCTGGDYWSEGEWQFVCPVNGGFNRLLFEDYGVEYDKQRKIGVAAEPTFKALYRGLFASSVDVRERHSTGATYNNYYADQRRDYFELPAKPRGRDAKR